MFESFLEYKSCEIIDYLKIQYYNCTFKKDFGPWKHGYSCECIFIDFDLYVIREYTLDGDVITRCSFTLDAGTV